jgi:prevent-host-death family protein
MTMKEIGAAKFKEHCLRILDEVDDEGLLITKRGRPVAKLSRVGVRSAALIGALDGKLAINGEIFSTGVAWRAQP